MAVVDHPRLATSLIESPRQRAARQCQVHTNPHVDAHACCCGKFCRLVGALPLICIAATGLNGDDLRVGFWAGFCVPARRLWAHVFVFDGVFVLFLFLWAVCLRSPLFVPIASLAAS